MTFKKGDKKMFLDYEIIYCTNNDGIVLLKHEPYDHLGNFSTLDDAQQSAAIHFMIARPDKFAQCIHNRIMHGPKSGTMHEWFILKNALINEEIEMPDELKDPIDGMNIMIGYKGKHLRFQKEPSLSCHL